MKVTLIMLRGICLGVFSSREKAVEVAKDINAKIIRKWEKSKHMGTELVTVSIEEIEMDRVTDVRI